MRALVTGSAGFVGRHMTEALLDRGYVVHGVDLALGTDARDVFRRNDIVYDLVVHCAYHVGGRAAMDGNPWLLAWNQELDAAMFSWAARTMQRRVVYFSSAQVYPVHLQYDDPEHRFAETEVDLDDVRSPDGRYGWAKLAGEQMARAAQHMGVAVHVVRPFSGYGADQDETYPFPALLARAAAHEDPFEVWGTGRQRRDFIHIDDIVAGVFAVVDAGVYGPVNLCTGRGSSILDLVGIMCGEAGYSPRIAPRESAPTGALFKVGDPAKMFTVYTPKVSLEEGVARALAASRV